METSRVTGIFDSTWGSTPGAFALPPSVVFVVAPDGSGRLFDLEDSFHAVDAVGVQMLRCGLHEDHDSAIKTLALKYGVDPILIGKDYDVFFADLSTRGLVSPRGATPCNQSRWHAAILMRILFVATCRLPLRQQAWALLALARLSIRIFGWNETRRIWLRYPGPTRSLSGTSPETVVEVIRRSAAGHLVGVTCKERSLSCLALCRATGIPATLVLGISLFPLASHCWCESEEDPLTDFADRIEGFTPVVRYT